MKFKIWLENKSIDAAEVLQMIQQSPQFQSAHLPQTYWGRYVEQWGVRGTFVRNKLPVQKIVDLINSRRIQISQNRNQQDIQAKIKSGVRNPLIIGKPNGGAFPYAILDGSHSLEAAFQAGDEWIEAIVPSEFTV